MAPKKSLMVMASSMDCADFGVGVDLVGLPRMQSDLPWRWMQPPM